MSFGINPKLTNKRVKETYMKKTILKFVLIFLGGILFVVLATYSAEKVRQTIHGQCGYWNYAGKNVQTEDGLSHEILRFNVVEC